MSVTSQTPINRYAANGVTTVFPYSFKIVSQGDIKVTVDGVVKALTTDYTVSGVGVDAGGNITFISAPASGTTVVVKRDMQLLRNTDYQDNGDLLADTLNPDQDAPVLMIQQIAAAVLLALRAPDTDSASLNTELPVAASRALKYLGFDASGNATVLDGSGTATDSQLVTFLQAGAGAVSRSSRDKMREFFSPNDYQTDWTADASAAFNKAAAYAAATGALLVIPKRTYTFSGTWLITDDNPYGACNGLKCIIEAGTILRASTTFAQNILIEVDNVADIDIEAYGVVVDGNILNRVGWPAFQSTNLAGVAALAGRHFNLVVGNTGPVDGGWIRGFELRDAGNDNVYIRGGTKYVDIDDVYCYGAVRNNISICSVGERVRLKNPVCENARNWWTDDFGYGIDIEPATASETVKDLEILNPVTRKNYDGGIYVLLANIDNTSTNDTRVSVRGGRDFDSGWDTNAGAHHGNKAVGFAFYGPNTSATISSDIDFIACESKNANNYAFEINRAPGNLGSVRVKDCHAEDWNRLASSSSANVGAIAINSRAAGTQLLPVHISGTMHKKDNVAGEVLITYGTGQETYENVWLGDLQVSGSVNPRIYGIAGITSTNMLGSSTLAAGVAPKCSFHLMPGAVHVTGTGTQTISNNSVTKITAFASGTESGSGYYNFGRDFSLTNSEWTPKEPGLYMVFAKTKLGTLVDNSRVYLALFQDPATGSFAELTRQETAIIGTAATNQNFTFCQPVLVPATGYKYDLRILQVTGGNSDVLGSSTDFFAVRVG